MTLEPTDARVSGEKVCSLCNGTHRVRDNIGEFDYPETAPCPKCDDGEWAYRALLKRSSTPQEPDNARLRHELALIGLEYASKGLADQAKTIERAITRLQAKAPETGETP